MCVGGGGGGGGLNGVQSGMEKFYHTHFQCINICSSHSLLRCNYMVYHVATGAWW